MSGVLVVGAGGHAKVVIATLRAAGQAVAGILDDRPESWGRRVLGVDVFGSLEQLDASNVRAVIAIGSNSVRRSMATRYPHVEWVSACHPSAVVDSSVTIGAGTVVFAGAVVQPDVIIGRHVIVNTGATVDHDCTLEDYVHVAPGVHLAGSVHLCEGAFLGVGAVAVPGVTVGAWSTVGAGAGVVRSLPANIVATGLPAQPKGSKL